MTLESQLATFISAIGTDWKAIWAKIGSASLTTTATNLIAAINELKVTADAPMGVYYVKSYGAVGNGSTNDSTAVQNAIDAAATAGGGLVVFGSGTFCVKVIIKTGVHIQGAGYKATVLKLPNSSAAASDVIIGENWVTQTGTDTGGGPYSWSVQSLSIDGNVANNATGGCGIKVYGRDFVLRDLRIYNCASHGMLTEWADGSFDSIGMEALWHNVKAHNNGAWGFKIEGPHDSHVENCFAYDNASGGFSASNKANATLFRTCHSWGTQAIAVLLGQESCEWVDGQAEVTISSGYTCIKILYASCKVLGGVVFAPDAADTNTIGIQLGDGTHNVYATQVDTQINTCGGGALKFVGNDGGGIYNIMVNQPIGTPITTGTTPHATDVVNFPTLDGNAGNQLGLNGDIVRNGITAHYTRHRGGIPDGAAGWVYLGRWSTYNGGQRLKIEVIGSQYYDAVPSTVGRTTILASTGNASPTPNIAGVFWRDGGGAVLTEVKAKRVGSDQLKWDIYIHAADYVGASHFEVSTGTAANPATWTYSGTATTDPGAASTTIAAFVQAAYLDGVAITGTPTAGQVLTTTSATAATWASRADVQIFTGSGTWTKPAGATKVTVTVVGGGGGGGSGTRQATNTVASGGAGGGGGGMNHKTIPASVLSSTETVTVGTGGAGGTAITSNGAVGNNGVAGGASSFKSTSFMVASGGALGGGGSTGVATGGAGGNSLFVGGAGASSSATGLVGSDAATTTGAAPGGASGGGLTTGNAASSGGIGGTVISASGLAGGIAGVAGGTIAGGAGNGAPANSGLPGTGGGGGASVVAGTAGTGGAGAIYGAGGGGGGGSRNGQTSGAGGAGANGIVIVISE